MQLCDSNPQINFWVRNPLPNVYKQQQRAALLITTHTYTTAIQQAIQSGSGRLTAGSTNNPVHGLGLFPITANRLQRA